MVSRINTWAQRVVDAIEETDASLTEANTEITNIDARVTNVESGASRVLWEWNGEDVLQFDPTAVLTAGQAATIALRADAATELSAGISLTGTWAGGGGAACFVLVPGQFVMPPEGCVVQMRVTILDANVNVGVFFHNDDTADFWGFGCGVYNNTNSLRVARAISAGAFDPFELPGATPNFTQMSNLSDTPLTGSMVEFELRFKAGAGGNPPIPLIYGRMFGGTSATRETTAVTPRGGLLSDGGAAPIAGWNDKPITGFGIILMSRVAAAFAAEIADLRILSLT